MTSLTASDVEAFFTRSTGEYLFARWGRPIVPIVFGTDDATLATVKGAVEALATLTGHQMAETDPELGVNLMVFFFRDWDELLSVPDLGRMVDGLADTVERLKRAQANQYRAFRFDQDGAIKAAFVFVRMDDAMSVLPAADIALMQAVQVMVLWSDTAFNTRSPLARAGDTAVLHPDIAALLAACYDRVLPVVARDPSHALRVAARLI
jgi:hypothetical protein